MIKEQKRTGLPSGKTGEQVLDMYFLEARSHLLETAAILDRIQRAAEVFGQSEKVMGDQRIKNLYGMCDIICREKGDRARKVLNMLSVPS